MAIKDYWVYQKRDVPVPWALYVVKEYDKRKGMSATTLDYTFYHENVPTQTNAKSRVGVHHDSVAGYVDEISEDIANYTGVDEADKEQLRTAIERILLD